MVRSEPPNKYNNIMETSEKEFLQKLKQLLSEYNMNIRFDCADNSDTHGLINDRIIIENDKTRKSIFKSNDWYITANNIKI
jgi:hypothetical protein